MNNPILGQFESSNPEGMISAPRGSRFFRQGNDCFLFKNGSLQKLDFPKKSYLLKYKNAAWFASLKEEIITFTTEAESWLKTSGNEKTGWTLLGNFSGIAKVGPVPISPILGDILGAFAGSFFTYFLKNNGDLYSAGENYDGQLGLGFTSERETSSLVLNDVKKAVSGMYSYFGFALKNDNTLWGTGNGGNGQWGNGTSDNYNVWTEITLDGDITGSGYVVDVACGEQFAAFLMSDNTLWGAGNDMGIGISTPIQIDTNVTAISAGGYHLLYIKDDATLWAIGDNDDGQLGTGDNVFHNYDDPVQIDTNVKAVGCGGYHSGYIKTDDTLWMTGANWDGQLGLGDYNDRNTPEQVTTDVKTIKGGSDHTLYIKNNNTLWGMGNNADGQLGIETPDDLLYPAQMDTNISSISTGNDHTIYLKTNNTLYGAGDNYYLCLGSPVYSVGVYSSNVTTGWMRVSENYLDFKNSSDRNWRDMVYADGKFVAGGGEGATIIKYSTDGIVWQTASIYDNQYSVTGLAYGSGSFVAVTEINDGRPNVYTSTDGITWASSSVNVNNPYGFHGITYGGGQFVAVNDGATAISPDGVNWTESTRSYDGFIGRVAYGNGTYAATTTYGTYPSPTATHEYEQVFENQTASFVSATAYQIFLIKDGTLYAYGDTYGGSLGMSDVGFLYNFTPVASNVKTVNAHSSHTTFVKNDDTLWGMGNNSQNQLGNIPPINYTTTVQIDTNVSQSFGKGFFSTFYVKNDGTLWGVGGNNWSQIADQNIYGTRITSSLQIDTDVKMAAAGDHFLIYVKNDGTLWARGYNEYGQLGTGDTNQRTSSVQIDSGSSYCSVGEATSFYVKNDGSLYGMGRNWGGELGLGDYSTRNTPTMLTSSGVVLVEAEYNYSQYITTDGKIYSSGNNPYGQFGTGDASNYTTYQLATVSGSVQIASNIYKSTMIKNDGTVWVTNGTDFMVEKGTYSTDGITWSSSLVPGANFIDIAFGNGKFLMITDDGSLVASSTDAINWTASYMTTSSYVAPSRIIFDGTKFVVFNSYSDKNIDIYTSTDGLSWSYAKTGQRGGWNAAAYGNDKYVALVNSYVSQVNPVEQITIG